MHLYDRGSISIIIAFENCKKQSFVISFIIRLTNKLFLITYLLNAENSLSKLTFFNDNFITTSYSLCKFRFILQKPLSPVFD